MSDATGLDAIINDLRDAKDAESLTFKVSKSVKTVAQPAFFLRLAEMAESAEDDRDRVALQSLAERVTDTLERLVEFAEKKMDDSSSLVQIIVSSAAEKDGEFLVPLSEERLSAMRKSVRIHRDSLDNNFLATVQAWMDKSKKEGMEGMVTILQKVLQLYASEEILYRKQLGEGGTGGRSDGGEDSTASSSSSSGRGFAAGESSDKQGDAKAGGSASSPKTPAISLLDSILCTDEEKWDAMLSGLSAPGREMSGGVSKEGLLGAVQAAIETVILQQENGSMAQRVQAEFLSELCRRIEQASPERPPGMGT